MLHLVLATSESSSMHHVTFSSPTADGSDKGFKSFSLLGYRNVPDSLRRKMMMADQVDDEDFELCSLFECHHQSEEAGVKLSHSIDALVKLEVEAGYKDGIVSYDQ